MSFSGSPLAVDAQHFWKQLLTGSLSGGRQFIFPPATDSGSEAGWWRGLWKRVHSKVRLEAEEGGHNGCRQEGHFCSAYLEVVITVSGFIFPCITGCGWPLGRGLHVKAINNIKNVQCQRER